MFVRHKELQTKIKAVEDSLVGDVVAQGVADSDLDAAGVPGSAFSELTAAEAQLAEAKEAILSWTKQFIAEHGREPDVQVCFAVTLGTIPSVTSRWSPCIGQNYD
jgi:hypothetical protein